MNIRIQQFNPTVGDLKGNSEAIFNFYRNAVEEDVDLIIFPELSLCGYPPMDLLERRDFIKACEEYYQSLAKKTSNTTLIIGAPVKNTAKNGRPLYNSAIVMQHGAISAIVHKTLLPTYDVFDEFRYFEPNTRFEPVTINGRVFGITICEDLWNNQNEIEYHKYDINPAEKLKHAGAECIINISASPFTKKKPELRVNMLKGHARALNLPVVYANQTGANTEILFDGDSMGVNPDGSLAARQALFAETYADLEFAGNTLQSRNQQNAKNEDISNEERIFQALVTGLRDYVNKTGISEDVVLGLSGGIDSALTAVIAAEALGSNHVHGITMPSEFSSTGSVSDSEKLATNLGIDFDTLPIGNIYDSFSEVLKTRFEGTEFGVAEENLQSRSRGVLLMALSNKFGWLLLNTGNKSELAVGYCTLYGDMAGGLSILADVYKTEVFAICRWLNDSYYKKEVIPESIITKPPSAELRPDQKDTDSLPEYDVLDLILYKYIEEQASKKEIIEEIDDENLVKRVLRMVDLNEYKRRQSAPGLRVSAKAFGVGRRLPIVQKWTEQE